MKQGGENTKEERVVIVKDSLEHGYNYGTVSYQQVYTRRAQVHSLTSPSSTKPSP